MRKYTYKSKFCSCCGNRTKTAYSGYWYSFLGYDGIVQLCRDCGLVAVPILGNRMCQRRQA